MDDPHRDAETFDELLDFVFPLAEQRLREDGEFLPFAAATDATGQIVAVDASPLGARPTTHQVLEVLLTGLRAGAGRGEYVASGVCSNVLVDEPETGEFDAIRIHFEARSGEVVDYFRPYELGDDGPAFGEPFLRVASPYVFFLPGAWTP